MVETVKLQLVFMGTPDFSVVALQGLLEAGHDVVCVYSQPPRKAGRGQKLRPSPVHAFAEKHGIEVRTPHSLKSKDAQKAFADLRVDAAVVVAYGLILPRAILQTPRLGCFNIHASLLPRWRGAAPIQRAIMAGDQNSGVTIMRMDEGLDTGDMALMAEVPITDTTTAPELHDALAVLGARLIVAALERIAAGTLTLRPQPKEGVSYAKKIDKAETHIDWTLPATKIAAQVRGLFPLMWFELNAQRVRVLAATAQNGAGVPGITLDDKLLVVCGEGALRLERLQRAGRGPVDAQAFLNGNPVARGTIIPSEKENHETL